ncbi:ankyrin repeat-containing domain protein [Thelonectria olida]|uniref:Ankyrin repeat-containing domain protein n=1 Tax=Thelonectria olida TaxID=1576542 RepID=A0A9P8VZY9_9HYPO|nr:ankyrin repeat-containing domain protein [Thelonectria olida]
MPSGTANREQKYSALPSLSTPSNRFAHSRYNRKTQQTKLSFLDVPSEVLHLIAADVPLDADLGALIRAHRRFNTELAPYLYRRQDRALKWALQHGRAETFQRTIVCGIDIYDFNWLHGAARHGHATIGCQYLGTRRQESPHPIAHGYFERQRDSGGLLLSRGADLEAVDANGFTPLFLAVNSPLLASVRGKTLPNMVQLLLDHNVEVNARTKGLEMTPLLYALENCRTVEMLLDHGANPKAKFGPKRKGWTALHETSRHDCIRALLKYGADIEAKDDEGYTPLHVAALRSFRSDMDGANLSSMQFLLAQGASISAVTPCGWTAIHLANVAALLTHDGSNMLNCTDYVGRSALFFAAKNGRMQVVKILLEAGASVSMLDRFGAGPIIAAARNGHSELVENLLANRSENGTLESKDIWGISAAEWGYKSGRRQMIAFLEDTMDTKQGGDVAVSGEEERAASKEMEDVIGERNLDNEPSHSPTTFTAPWEEADDSSSEGVTREGAQASDNDSGEDEGSEDLEFDGTDYDGGSDASSELSDVDLLRYSKSVYFVWCDTCTRSISPDETALKCKDCPHGGWIICEDCAATSRGCMDPSHTTNTKTRIKVTCAELENSHVKGDLLHCQYYLCRGLRYPVEWCNWAWYSLWETFGPWKNGSSGPPIATTERYFPATFGGAGIWTNGTCEAY